VEIVRSLARDGPRRFYVLNTAGSATPPLQDAVDVLSNEGILLGYTSQTGTSHADANETSMMLLVDPSAVDMKKAVRELGEGSGPMTRQKGGPGVFSASGVLGDPTVATRENGQQLVEQLVARAVGDIEKLRRAPLPQARPGAPTPPSSAPRGAGRGEALQANGCTPGDERTIREVGTRFSFLWRQMDSESIAMLFAGSGDIRHPDGTIERGQNIILANRRELFTRREYRGSVHPVYLNDIRCLGPNHAIADGKWELRLVPRTTGSEPRGPNRFSCTGRNGIGCWRSRPLSSSRGGRSGSSWGGFRGRPARVRRWCRRGVRWPQAVPGRASPRRAGGAARRHRALCGRR